MREAAKEMKVTLIGTPLRDPITEAEYERAFGIMTRERVQAVIVNDHPANYAHRRLIADLAGRARLPAMAALRDFPDAGGLMAYAADTLVIFRSMARYVDRILRGARPAELPFSGAHDLRLRGEPQDRQGARSGHSCVGPAAGKQGHRVSALVARCDGACTGLIP